MSALPRLLWTAALTVALAVGSVPLFAGVAPAQAAPPVSVKTSTSYPVRGKAFLVTGRLRTHIARPVALQWRNGSKWVTLTSATADKSGRYSLSVTAALTSYKLRVVAKKVRIGKRTYSRLVSSIRTLRTVAVTPVEPISGETFTVSDSLAGKKVARPVALQRLSGKRWVSVASGRTSSAGVFSLTTSTTASSAKYRVVAKKTRIKKKTYRAVVTKAITVTTAAQSGTLSMPASGVVGGGLVASLSFSPARPGRAVRVEMLVGGSWQQVGSGTQDADGKASVAVSPTVDGTVSFRGMAEAANGASQVLTSVQTVEVDPGVPAPAAVVGAFTGNVVDGNFEGVVSASGGTTPYQWAVTGLPGGVSLDPDTGVLSGTPTESGTFSVTFTVTDAKGKTATVTTDIVVRPLVGVGTTSLPAAVVGTDYTFALAASGGTEPFTWAADALPTWLSLNSDGTLTGVPTAVGTDTVTVTVTDVNHKTATATFSLVVGPAVSVTTSSLPSVIAGDDYSVTLAAAGGTSPYSWSASGLPAGVSVSADQLVGTPTTAGTSSVTLTVTDDAGKTATATLDLVVLPALGVGTPQIPEGTAGEPYTGSVPATGGTAPYTWTAWGLPEGMTINSHTGEITGTPPNGGTFIVIVTVTDSEGHSTTTQVEITVGAGSVAATPPGITTTGLLDATKDASYAVTMAATAGTTPYVWSAYGLPQGLSLNAATGEISGTPTKTGESTVYAMVTDAAGLASTTKSFALKVFAAAEQPPSPQITTSSLPDGVVDDAYGLTLATTSGRAPFVWTQTGLPSGLSLNATTGVISGTPTATGTSTVHLTVTDKNGKTDTANLELVVRAAVHTTIDSLPSVVANEDYSVNLTAAGGTTPYTWSASGLPAGISVSGAKLTGTPTESGTFSVALTVTDDHSKTATVNATLVVTPAVSVTTPSLPSVVAGDGYSVTLAATGGTSPYSWAATGLPAGISVSGDKLVGTPTTAGTTSVTLTVTDGHDKTATATLDFTVLPALGLGTPEVPEGTAGEPYTGSVPATGGTAPYTWTAWGLPPGMAINSATGEITGTPPNPGTFPVLVTVTDAEGRSTTSQVDLVFTAGAVTATAPQITTTGLLDATKDAAYSVTLAATEGTTPYVWSAYGLPEGVSLNSATGEVSGTPTKTGESTVYVMVADAAGLASTTSFALKVFAAAEEPPSPQITTSDLPDGVVGDAYSLTLATTSGRAPFVWSQTGLPAGLTLAPATGVIAGTPTVAGTSTVQLIVTDKNGKTDTANLELVVRAAVHITTSSLPGVVANEDYSTNLVAAGGTTPYQWVASGLPSGLSIDAATGALTGTPTNAGTSSVTFTVTDAKANTDAVTLDLIVTPAVAVTTATLTDAVVNEDYSLSLAASGGTAPYSWDATGLPAGISVSGNKLVGTPTSAGTKSVELTVTDDHNKTATVTLTLVVRPVVSISTTAVPDGIVGHALNAQLEAAGGTLPYSWSATGLPLGLTLDAETGALSGTPTDAGDYTAHITVTDDKGRTDTVNLPMAIGEATTITTSALPSGMVGYDYSLTLAAAGGLAPYSWTSADVPAGLTLSSGGVLSGNPTTAGTTTVHITATDDTGQTHTKSFELTIAAGVSVSTASLDRGEVGTAYSATLAADGGVAPYSWSQTDLPAGLALSTSGEITGTPTTAGTSQVGFTVSDSNGKTSSKTVQLVIGAAVAVATSSLPGAIVGTAYSATLAADGGTTPYTWAVQDAPSWLNVNTSTGALSGTPDATDSWDLTVTVTDANLRSNSRELSLTASPAVVINTATLPNAVKGTAYSTTVTASGGRTPYAWSAANLPGGLSIDSATGEISGTPATAETKTVTITVTDHDTATTSVDLQLVVGPAVSVTTTSLPDAVSGTSYAFTLTASGGTAPYSWSVSGLPTGLTYVASTGVISGTTTQTGTWELFASVTDANGKGSLAMMDLVVKPAVSVTTTTLPSGVVGTAYSQTLTGANGTSPYTWTSTALPAGLSLSSDGVVSGTPTTTGTTSVTFTIHDFNAKTATKVVSMVVNPAVSVTTTSLAAGVVGTAYSQTLAGANGTSPYTWTSTTLPDGLSLSSGGVISGTPTTVGTTSVTFTVHDANDKTATAVLSIVVGPAVSVTTTSLPDAVSGTAYSTTVTASGGTTPYSWSISGLPTGLTYVASTGVISGTTTQTGTWAVNVSVSDANGKGSLAMMDLVVKPAVSVATTSLPSGVVGTAYSQSLTGADGTSPYTWTSTTLPAGLSLSSGGVISGTPTTTGTTSVTFTIKDANNKTATKALSMVVNPAVSVTTGSLPSGVVGTAYSQTLVGANGTSPYTWTSTVLPDGLSLSSDGVISGTPTTIGTTSVTFTIHDANAKTATKVVSMVVNPAVSVATTSLPSGVVGTAYSQTLAGANGTSPYTWTSTTLPAGLSLSSAGVLSGTPTTSGTTSVTFTIKDANDKTATKMLSMVVNPAVSVTTSSLPAAVVGTAYSQTLAGANGTSPYTWTSTTLPAGLSLSSAGVLSGTPTTSGTTSVTFTIKDANDKTATKMISMVINPAVSVATTSLAVAAVGSSYSQTLAGADGTSPYTWSSTTLPAGLSLNGSTGVISGSPTTAGTTSVTFTITDSNSKTATKTISMVVNPAVSVSTTTLAPGMLTVAYSASLTGAGGVPPYTWSSTALPSGLVLDSSTGAISGTPTTAGTTTVTFTVTDSGGKTATKDLSITVTTPLTLGSLTLPNGALGTAYDVQPSASGGQPSYTWSATGLPAGLSINTSTGAISGTPTASGTFAVVVTVTDSVGNAASTGSLSLVVPADTQLVSVDTTCAVTSAGTVKCWGANGYGQLGNGTTTDSATPVQVSGLEGVASVSVAPGSEFACAVTTGGAVKCWGYNYYGGLGNGTTTNSSTPVQVSGLTSGVSRVSVGGSFACAVTTGGAVKCWGYNLFGQLGNGTTSASATTTPQQVSGLTSGVTEVSTGQEHACAIVSGGVKCWGSGYYGQLGNYSNANSSVPVQVSGVTSGATAVGVGFYHSCAVVTNSVLCWGDNSRGELGNNSTSNTTYPVSTWNSTGATALVGGNTFACAIISGAVKCWGQGGQGQLGNNTTTDSLTPVQVSGLTSGIAALGASNYAVCALSDTGHQWCWGYNEAGVMPSLGIGSKAAVPAPVVGSVGITSAVAAGDYHTCLVTTSGGVKCLGYNNVGQLGNNSTTNSSTLVDVYGLTSGVTAVAAGDSYACALLTGKTVRCWGVGANGRLGNGSTSSSSTPVQVSGLSDVVAISAGASHACALISGGTVKCWGYNYAGQLGNNTTTTATTPVAVSNLSDASAVSVGDAFSCALTTSGAVKCWGRNDYGQLANGTYTNSSVPVASSLTTGVAALSGPGSDGSHMCAVLTDGAVKCWGRNDYGQLGDGTTTSRNAPVSVSGLGTGNTAVSVGASHTCAVTASGGIKCWGYSGSALLGTYSSPAAGTLVDVAAPTSGVSSIAAGSSHTCVVTPSHTAQCWGDNTFTKLGRITMYSSTPLYTTGL